MPQENGLDLLSKAEAFEKAIEAIFDAFEIPHMIFVYRDGLEMKLRAFACTELDRLAMELESKIIGNALDSAQEAVNEKLTDFVTQRKEKQV